MKNKIINALKDIERQESVKILYAVESGSRGWGFASKDSDYDVRFIYVHGLDWYLSLEEKREVIEYNASKLLDISGWDIKKALKLFKSSNPPLYEWLYSPIIYIERAMFAQRLRQLLPMYYSPKSCLYHYLSMAKKNYRQYLTGERVRVKKYFYVLRPILACMWIENQKTMPPMEFEKLLHAQKLEEELLEKIEDLLRRKRNGAELDRENKITVINIFLEEKIAYFEKYVRELKAEKAKSNAILDELFKNMVKQV